jgi:hypothetical protein
MSTADFRRLLEKVYQQGELNRLVVDEVSKESEAFVSVLSHVL